MNAATQTPQELLEGLVDRSNVWLVVEALAVVAEEKATHVRENWQDERLAKQWERAARILDRATAQLVKVGLP